jgi:putative endonuclease
MLDRMALPATAPPVSWLPARLWIDTQAWAIRRLHSLHRSRVAPHLETGSLGEREALFHLRRNGYIVVARRWKSAKVPGDLDLIAWHGSVLCFIEVKTRSRRDAFAAELAVDSHKQTILRRLARVYLHRLPPPVRPSSARFDVVSVYLASDSGRQPSTHPDFELNQGAFGWE